MNSVNTNDLIRNFLNKGVTPCQTVKNTYNPKKTVKNGKSKTKTNDSSN